MSVHNSCPGRWPLHLPHLRFLGSCTAPVLSPASSQRVLDAVGGGPPHVCRHRAPPARAAGAGLRVSGELISTAATAGAGSLQVREASPTRCSILYGCAPAGAMIEQVPACALSTALFGDLTVYVCPCTVDLHVSTGCQSCFTLLKYHQLCQ